MSVIHHVPLNEFLGKELMETECNIIVTPVRDERHFILGFKTNRGHKISCTVYSGQGATCLNCKRELNYASSK